MAARTSASRRRSTGSSALLDRPQACLSLLPLPDHLRFEQPLLPLESLYLLRKLGQALIGAPDLDEGGHRRDEQHEDAAPA